MAESKQSEPIKRVNDEHDVAIFLKNLHLQQFREPLMDKYMESLHDIDGADESLLLEMANDVGMKVLQRNKFVTACMKIQTLSSPPSPSPIGHAIHSKRLVMIRAGYKLYNNHSLQTDETLFWNVGSGFIMKNVFKNDYDHDDDDNKDNSSPGLVILTAKHCIKKAYIHNDTNNYKFSVLKQIDIYSNSTSKYFKLIEIENVLNDEILFAKHDFARIELETGTKLLPLVSKPLPIAKNINVAESCMVFAHRMSRYNYKKKDKYYPQIVCATIIQQIDDNDGKANTFHAILDLKLSSKIKGSFVMNENNELVGICTCVKQINLSEHIVILGLHSIYNKMDDFFKLQITTLMCEPDNLLKTYGFKKGFVLDTNSISSGDGQVFISHHRYIKKDMHPNMFDSDSELIDLSFVYQNVTKS